MLLSLSPAEQFLVSFHDRRPGITALAYGALVAHRGECTFGSSYESLIAEISDADIRVLDIACGDGYLLSLLERRAPSRFALTGTDLSPGEIAAAHRRLKGTASLHCCRAQRLPIADNSMDHVVCHLALMLMDELDAVLQEVRRVLVAGGRFSFIVGASPPAGQVALDLFVARVQALRSGDGARFIRFGDARLRSPDGIKQVLSTAFSDISIHEINLPRRYTPSELWDWFEGMYDLHFFTANEQDQFKSGYLTEIEKFCEPDGKLGFIGSLRQVSGTAT
jgi:SAM-dependent methyltransferase